MGRTLVFPLIGQNIIAIYLELTAHCSGKSGKMSARHFLFIQTLRKKFECSSRNFLMFFMFLESKILSFRN